MCFVYLHLKYNLWGNVACLCHSAGETSSLLLFSSSPGSWCCARTLKNLQQLTVMLCWSLTKCCFPTVVSWLLSCYVDSFVQVPRLLSSFIIKLKRKGTLLREHIFIYLSIIWIKWYWSVSELAHSFNVAHAQLK